MTKNRGHFCLHIPEISCIIEYMNTNTVNQLTDDEIMARLDINFRALDVMAEATAKGLNRSLIVYGAPGVGKTWGVEKVLNNLPPRLKYTAVSGSCTAPALYELLYKNKEKTDTLLIDDCDNLIVDEQGLNLLKGATDTKDCRIISWKSKTKIESEEGQEIPKSFEYEGNVIILTNKDVAEMSRADNKLSEHLKALLSRSQYIDLSLSADRNKFLRVKQVIQNGMLLEKGVDYGDQCDILYFMESNLDRLREISLRTSLKIASLIRIDRNNWKALAKTTCCYN